MNDPDYNMTLTNFVHNLLKFTSYVCDNQHFLQPLNASFIARTAMRQTGLDLISAVTIDFCLPKFIIVDALKYKAKEQ